ncbi:pyruvate kinase [Maridesulfovibrio hydrothermalis]|uniref:Pyruvate kinase n=1 Tax=Maridesulfovibrio hydrothermalis AM13 = DSM 14728 TaxID=1121451 RepID=L0R741_9BACT|nr:pyruvate kinase [Maridesulfovibrio hydrothermalis]CCO22032.1 Pyruvate kinase [Maridesulfovibrio hydrothermalis AM13 = DSM 14728]
MRTKVIATLGPASGNVETIRKMVLNGVRILRLNFSHSDAESFRPLIAKIRQVEEDLNIPLTVMGDLCGPKIRIGVVDGAPHEINAHSDVYLGLPEIAGKATDRPFIPLDQTELLQGLEDGMEVSLSDGMLQFKVTETIEKDKLYRLEAQNGGLLSSRKGITFPGKNIALAAFTDKDRVDLTGCIDIGVDAVAMSFVQTASDVEDVQAEIAKRGVWLPVIAKIERQNAVDNIEDILKVADGIMVARGDLGLECKLSAVPVIQKKLIRAARHAQKPVIVATQMMLSMVKNPIPTRAEANDVANAIMDGADCCMLSEETAIGDYPAEAVGYIREIAEGTEPYYLRRIDGPYKPKKEINPIKYLSYSACLLADNIDSPAILCHSSSGASARVICSRRPEQQIYCLTPDKSVPGYLNFFWGMIPVVTDSTVPDHRKRLETYLEGNKDFPRGKGYILVSGQPTPGQTESKTNEIKLYYK